VIKPVANKRKKRKRKLN